MSSKGTFVPLDTLITNTYYVLKDPMKNRPAEFNHTPRSKQNRTFTFESEVRLCLMKMENLKIKGEVRTPYKGEPTKGTKDGYTSVPSAKKDVRESKELLTIVIPVGSTVEYFGVEKGSHTLCFVPGVLVDGQLCQLNVFTDSTFSIRAY